MTSPSGKPPASKTRALNLSVELEVEAIWWDQVYRDACHSAEGVSQQDQDCRDFAKSLNLLSQRLRRWSTGG